jgi:serine/threonine-protein kinase
MSPTGGVSRTGSIFRGYEILEKLGAGGMGVVYRARDSKLGRSVALKFLPATSTSGSPERQRFLLEAQACSALDHPNVGVIHGIEEAEDGELCIVMACYEGRTLGSRIGGSPMPPAEAVRIAAQIADGLAEAHAHGIVHRDIKPANIFLPSRGGVKILDFGLAKLLHADAGLTQTEMRVGTPAYMSPEQIRGLEVNERTDIWALGAVLYEMLAGKRPFRGGDSYSLVYAVVHSDPDRTSLASPELESIVFKALNKDPANRYGSMQEFADVLRRTSMALESKMQSETVLYSKEALSVPAPSLPLQKKRRWLLPVLGAILIAAATGLYYLPLFHTASSPTTLAILPFSSSADPAAAALAGGFAEALTGRVTQFEQFRDSFAVIPVSELVSRKIKDPADARKRLAATMVVSGDLARDAKGGIRLNFQVEGRAYPKPVSSFVEDPSGDVNKLEDRASAAIARMLDIGSEGSKKSGGSASKAYEPYLRGLGISTALGCT